MRTVTSTHSHSTERGAVTIKTVIALVLIGIVAFLAIKVAPVYIEQQRVVHDVNELARIAAVRGWKVDRINQDIKRISDAYSLPDDGINFVASGDKGVHIAVSYQRNIDLLVTTYEWKVAHTAVGRDL
jgi:hypothetical protein